MKDIKFKLTAKRQKTELIIWGICFLFAFLLNVYSIIAFDTEWKELYTQLLWVLSLSIGFYFLILFLRLVYRLIHSILCKKK
jgi:TRAP-type C4-dicarboxylate transport system permease small subunit